MEALSPRSINIQAKQRPRSKDMVDDEAKKAEAARKAQKEKEYAPPPPEWVIQPPVVGSSLAEKFKTGRLLGKGGFAVCYEGELRSKKNGQTKKNLFALKIVRSKMSQKKMEEKFRTELQIHAKMRHPNIVEFYRAFTFKECTYVVLELCSNGSVMDMVKKRKCLTLPEVRRLTIQLCGAIKYMHARNVIHRDLKMGNLFLDDAMNLKIGDFGLAAVLVSKDEAQGLIESAKQRRTTLCGTPNYIAPEILEKGKGGHDHKVDIWAIGIIVFAMLAGQPPFQSSSQTEIYRRAKNIEYSWPEEGKCSNDIPPEARDLVACLLKVDAEERPDPDEVIGHPFFAMQGGKNIPAIMDSSQRYEVPSFINYQASPRGDVIWDDTKRVSLRTIAKHCGVGHLSGDTEPQAAVGADTSLSLYMECVAEEQSGVSPIVPLPHDFVYASKFPSTVWPSLQESVSEEPVPPKSDAIVIDLTQDQPAIRGDRYTAPQRPRRAPVQSHAATLRAAHQSNRAPPKPSVKILDPDQGSDHFNVNNGTAPRRRRGLMTDLPIRPSAGTNSTVASNITHTDQNPDTKRARDVIILDDSSNPMPEAKATLEPTSSSTETAGVSTDVRVAKQRDLAAKTHARITANARDATGDPTQNERKTSRSLASANRSRQVSQTTIRTLIGPHDCPESIQFTRPESVLERLEVLSLRLEMCLQSNGNVKRTAKEAREIIAKSTCFKNRPVVIKWVDYTNKFGIGYILANGSVGCVFKGDSMSPPTCVMVSDSESHFKKRNSPSYTDRNQIVPSQGSPVEFVENRGPEGLKRVLVQPCEYQVRVSSTGVADHLGPGFNAFDHEKRKKLSLWDKFGKYMTQSLGKNEEKSDQTDAPRPSRTRRTAAAGGGPFVKFYQRLGNVGIWGFADGSFQFNFPDHTKIVLGSDGAWMDFYHLTPSAARTLKSGQGLSPGALNDRSVLCYPSDILLSGHYGTHEFGDMIEENQLSDKVWFMYNVIQIWIKEKGLGAMGNYRGMKWDGMAEKGGKLVWVTVGAKGGDERYEDPYPSSQSSRK